MSGLTHGSGLLDAPRVAPPAALRALFARAGQFATQLGLRLPARIALAFVDLPEAPWGLTWAQAPGQVGVVLNCAMPPKEWPRVCLHELQHVADAGVGLAPDERERRAIEFSEGVLRWHWHGRW